MFCIHCGKQIMDTARFCNFCGQPTGLSVQPAVSPIQTAEAAEQPSDQNVNYQTDIPTPVSVSEVPVESAENGNTEVPAPSAEYSVPTPNVIPTSGVSVNVPILSAAETPAPFSENVSAVTAASSDKKPERKYTITHIMLCLISTAIMAITAGVFAGLYFAAV